MSDNTPLYMYFNTTADCQERDINMKNHNIELFFETLKHIYSIVIVLV